MDPAQMQQMFAMGMQGLMTAGMQMAQQPVATMQMAQMAPHPGMPFAGPQGMMPAMPMFQAAPAPAAPAAPTIRLSGAVVTVNTPAELLPKLTDDEKASLKDKIIRVTQLPDDVPDAFIRELFDRYGTIRRVSLLSYGDLQEAYKMAEEAGHAALLPPIPERHAGYSTSADVYFRTPEHMADARELEGAVVHMQGAPFPYFLRVNIIKAPFNEAAIPACTASEVRRLREELRTMAGGTAGGAVASGGGGAGTAAAASAGAGGAGSKEADATPLLIVHKWLETGRMNKQNADALFSLILAAGQRVSGLSGEQVDWEGRLQAALLELQTGRGMWASTAKAIGSAAVRVMEIASTPRVTDCLNKQQRKQLEDLKRAVEVQVQGMEAVIASALPALHTHTPASSAAPSASMEDQASAAMMRGYGGATSAAAAAGENSNKRARLDASPSAGSSGGGGSGADDLAEMARAWAAAAGVATAAPASAAASIAPAEPAAVPVVSPVPAPVPAPIVLAPTAAQIAAAAAAAASEARSEVIAALPSLPLISTISVYLASVPPSVGATVEEIAAHVRKWGYATGPVPGGAEAPASLVAAVRETKEKGQKASSGGGDGEDGGAGAGEKEAAAAASAAGSGGPGGEEEASAAAAAAGGGDGDAMDAEETTTTTTTTGSTSPALHRTLVAMDEVQLALETGAVFGCFARVVPTAHISKAQQQQQQQVKQVHWRWVAHKQASGSACGSAGGHGVNGRTGDK